jgi:hypothetical protein
VRRGRVGVGFGVGFVYVLGDHQQQQLSYEIQENPISISMIFANNTNAKAT